MSATARWALVTGGNRGLGLATAKQLVHQGKPTIITSRNPADGAKAVDELRAAAGGAGAKVEALPLDASDATSIAALAGAVGERFNGQVDLLVVNAGVLHKAWTANSYASCIAVNFTGAVDTALALAPKLAPGALVIFVSSSLGQLAKLSPDYATAVSSAKSLEELRAAAARFDPASDMPKVNAYSPDYSVSKAALNRAVQLLAHDGGAALGGAAVAAVCPGWCRTDMGSAAAERSPEQGAASILKPFDALSAGPAAAEARAAVNGSFTRDGEPLAW